MGIDDIRKVKIYLHIIIRIAPLLCTSTIQNDILYSMMYRSTSYAHISIDDDNNRLIHNTNNTNRQSNDMDSDDHRKVSIEESTPLIVKLCDVVVWLAFKKGFTMSLGSTTNMWIGKDVKKPGVNEQANR